MKTTVYFLLLVALFGCSDPDIAKGTPECIRKKIDSILKEGVANPPSKMYRYEYRGRLVYYIPSKCCDFGSILMDENCNVICSPDGGFSGVGDGRCADFFKERKNEKLIWEDTRKP